MSEHRDDDVQHLDAIDLPDAARAPAGSPGRRSLTGSLSPSATSVARAVVQLMRKEDGRDGNGVAAGAEDRVAAAGASSGAPLPAPVRAQFESSLGADLSSVRVHTGADSAAAAHAVGARAYTVGQDIHFGAGQYAPADPFGVHLLAHEVAHTVQQSGGAARKAQFKLEVSAPGDALEHEADRAADAMVLGAPATVGAATGLARATVMRDPLQGLFGQDPGTNPFMPKTGTPFFNEGDPANTYNSPLAPAIGPFKPNTDAFGVPYDVPTTDYRAAVAPSPPDLHADMPAADIPDPGAIPGWKTIMPGHKSGVDPFYIEVPPQEVVVMGDFHSTSIKGAWASYRSDGIDAVRRTWNDDARAKMSSYTMHAQGNADLDAMIKTMKTDFRMGGLTVGKGTLSEQAVDTNISGGAKPGALGSQVATQMSDPKSSFAHDLGETAKVGADGTVGGPVGTEIDKLKAARGEVTGQVKLIAGNADSMDGAQHTLAKAVADVKVVKLKKDVAEKQQQKSDIESGQASLKKIDPVLARLVKQVQSQKGVIKAITSIASDAASVMKGDYGKLLHIGETLLDLKKASEIEKIEEEIASITAEVEKQFELSAAEGLLGARGAVSGLAKTAAGLADGLRAKLLAEKIQFEAVAAAMEKNWKGKNKQDGALAAKALRAMPVVRKVVAVLDDIKGAMPQLPSMDTRSSQGYTLATQGVNAPGAAALHKVAGWITGAPAAIVPEVRMWNAILAQLETMLPAMMGPA